MGWRLNSWRKALIPRLNGVDGEWMPIRQFITLAGGLCGAAAVWSTDRSCWMPADYDDGWQVMTGTHRLQAQRSFVLLSGRPAEDGVGESEDEDQVTMAASRGALGKRASQQASMGEDVGAGDEGDSDSSMWDHSDESESDSSDEGQQFTNAR